MKRPRSEEDESKIKRLTKNSYESSRKAINEVIINLPEETRPGQLEKEYWITQNARLSRGHVIERPITNHAKECRKLDSIRNSLITNKPPSEEHFTFRNTNIVGQEFSLKNVTVQISREELTRAVIAILDDKNIESRLSPLDVQIISQVDSEPTHSEPTILPPEPLATNILLPNTCCVCKQFYDGMHYCSVCENKCHSFCGVGKEGYGAVLECNNCVKRNSNLF